MSSITSYAQNFEDVMLWRALGHIENGFYIDIGAQDPLIDSVSLAFHEHGWHGIHVEPTLHYAELLRQQRPGDKIIQTAISTESGVINFFAIPDTGISTADAVIAQQHRERGFEVHEITVVSMTLAAVFTFCAETDIHWLKIDVEGFEQQVLTSWSPSTVRPWVVVVESTLPLTQIETHETWESVLIAYGYTPVYFDGLNRYYLSNAHPELQPAFQAPPNVFDCFSLNGTASNSIHHLIAARHKQHISDIVAQNEKQGLAVKKEMDRLNQSLVELSQTHAEQQHASELHEAEITTQLHAIQQQAETEKIALSQQHHTQLQEIQRQHEEHEWLTNERIHQLNDALRQSQADSTAREQHHAENVAALQAELYILLRAQVQREQDFNTQLQTIRQQTETEKIALSQQHHTQLQELHRQQAEQERLTGERILQLNHTLQQLQADTMAREQHHAENVATLQAELPNLLRTQVQREQDFNSQLHTILQQAAADKIALNQQCHTQLQEMQRQHAERELLTGERIHTLNAELHQLQTNQATREQAHADNMDALQKELVTLLRMQVQREQEIAAQLLAMQQQADQEKAEQAHNHNEQVLALQREHTEREHAINQQLQAGQQELHSLEQTRTEMQHQLNAQLQAEREASQQLRQVLVDVQQRLETTHASLTWRMTRPLRSLASLIVPQKNLSAPSPVMGKVAVEVEPHYAILTTVTKSAPTNFEHVSDEAIMFPSSPTTNSPHPTVATTLDELLAYHDQQFVRTAYQTLLSREPDSEGLSYYLGRLRTGFWKLQIVAQIRLSKEGSARDVNLPGLDRAIQRYQRAQYPLLGWLFRLLDGTEGNHPTERKLRTIEHQIYLFSDESNRRFNQMEAALDGLRHLAVQQTQSGVAVLGGTQQSNSDAANIAPFKPSEPDGLKLLSSRARNIYFQLKTAVAIHAGKTA